MKLLWLGYLVYSLDNCVMKLCIETGLTSGLYFQTPGVGAWGAQAACLLLSERSELKTWDGTNAFGFSVGDAKAGDGNNHCMLQH